MRRVLLLLTYNILNKVHVLSLRQPEGPLLSLAWPYEHFNLYFAHVADALEEAGLGDCAYILLDSTVDLRIGSFIGIGTTHADPKLHTLLNTDEETSDATTYAGT